MSSIRSALQIGFPHVVKINVVVMRGLNDDEICDFVQMTESSPLDIRFIEYMPFDGNKWSSKKIVPYREILAKIRQKYPDLEPVIEEKNPSLKEFMMNQTSKPYRVKGFAGRIGFITSMTENFCSSCNRLRVTADGNLKVSSVHPNVNIRIPTYLSHKYCSDLPFRERGIITPGHVTTGIIRGRNDR